jgi:hypothetical protein
LLLWQIDGKISTISTDNRNVFHLWIDRQIKKGQWEDVAKAPGHDILLHCGLCGRLYLPVDFSILQAVENSNKLKTPFRLQVDIMNVEQTP